MKKHSYLIAAAAGFALLLTGCAAEGGADVAGNWGEQDGPFLTFEEGGMLTGNDGCNQLSGSWSQDGDTIEFLDVATTLMACEGVDTWLNGLSTAEVSGTALQVFDESGAEIGSLERQ